MFPLQLNSSAGSGKCGSTPLSDRLSQSRRGKRQANPCDVRHQSCTRPWSTSAKSVHETPRWGEESLARENGRVNYASLDRPDLSFAAGSLPRRMKSSTAKDLEELERVWRYLRGRPVGAIVGGVLRCRPCWRIGNTQVPLWNGSSVEVVLDEAWERYAKHHCVEQWRI